MHNLLCAETSVRLDLKVELVRLRIVVKGLVVARRVLLLRVVAERPLVPRVVLVPVRRVTQLVVRVVLERDGRAR